MERSKRNKKIENEFGPEPLEIDLSTFENLLIKRPNAKIKPLLMDQKFIAGIGNIYSDEILHAAKVYPLRCVKTLTNEEIEQIFQNLRRILNAAIKYQGSSVQYYLDTCGEKGDFAKYHKVYQKEGQKCSRCRTLIKKLKSTAGQLIFVPVARNKKRTQCLFFCTDKILIEAVKN